MKNDVFKIKKVIKVGQAELNFIISKNDKEIYVFSDFDPNKRSLIEATMMGRLEVLYFEDRSFKKITEAKRVITSMDGKAKYSISGKIVDITLSDVSINSGFILNVSVSKKELQNFKVGDFVSLSGASIWVYNLEAPKK